MDGEQEPVQDGHQGTGSPSAGEESPSADLSQLADLVNKAANERHSKLDRMLEAEKRRADAAEARLAEHAKKALDAELEKAGGDPDKEAAIRAKHDSATSNAALQRAQEERDAARAELDARSFEDEVRKIAKTNDVDAADLAKDVADLGLTSPEQVEKYAQKMKRTATPKPDSLLGGGAASVPTGKPHDLAVRAYAESKK